MVGGVSVDIDAVCTIHEMEKCACYNARDASGYSMQFSCLIRCRNANWIVH